MSLAANIEKRLGKYFLIRAKSQPDLVLEVKNGSNQTGSLIVLGTLKSEENHHEVPAYQLWFWNEQTSTIRCKLTSFCISTNESNLLVAQMYTASEKQQWVTEHGKYLVLKNSEDALSVKQHTMFAGAHCEVVPKEGLSEQQWAFTYLPAEYFFVHHRLSNRVMDIRGDSASNGAQLITYAKKEVMFENQLWWEDQHGVIHSKMHDFVIKVYDNDAGMYTYDNIDEQQWILNGSLIQNKNDPSMVLDVKPSSKFQAYAAIIPAINNTTQLSQEWSFQTLPHQPFSIDHDGTGKYFLIKQSFFDLYLTATDSSNYPIPGSVARLDLKRSGMFRDNQLLFHDTTNNVIRTKMNEKLCMEIIDSCPFYNPYEPSNTHQTLIISNNIKNNNNKYKKIHLKVDELVVLTIGTSDDENLHPSSVACYMAEDFKSHHQEWELVYGRAPLFYIQSKTCNKVLEVKRSADYSSCTVSLADRKEDTRCAFQLWYEDQNGLIRSHLNGFVLDTAYGNLHTDRFNALNQYQGWVVSKDHIRNKNTNLVLDTQKKWIGSSLGEAENNHTDQQCWNFLFV